MVKPSTFSVVAIDPLTGDLGVAVQSKFLAVGAVVPFARTGVGAIATQALCNVAYGPQGLALLAGGMPARDVLASLLSDDDGAERRQAAIVDAHGTAAAHTGAGCSSWAGHEVGEGFSCQGNILTSHSVVREMTRAMRDTGLPFPERLVAALAAGQAAGGDSRGMQSAALLVVREAGGYGGFSDRYIDLRVDDHPSPIEELHRLLDLPRLYFERPVKGDLVPVDSALSEEIAQRLVGALALSAAPAGTAIDEALDRWMGRENLEERATLPGFIDRRVLSILRESGTVSNT